MSCLVNSIISCSPLTTYTPFQRAVVIYRILTLLWLPREAGSNGLSDPNTPPVYSGYRRGSLARLAAAPAVARLPGPGGLKLVDVLHAVIWITPDASAS